MSGEQKGLVKEGVFSTQKNNPRSSKRNTLGYRIIFGVVAVLIGIVAFSWVTAQFLRDNPGNFAIQNVEVKQDGENIVAEITTTAAPCTYAATAFDIKQSEYTVFIHAARTCPYYYSSTNQAYGDILCGLSFLRQPDFTNTHIVNIIENANEGTYRIFINGAMYLFRKPSQ